MPGSELIPPFDGLVTQPTKFVSMYYDYLYFYENECFYSDYEFEKILYLYIFEILVIFTCLVNILVIAILLRKDMRSVTTVILSAIAISNSLSGLVTLPASITVYTSYYLSPDNFVNSSALVLTLGECGMVTKESEVEKVTQEPEVGYFTQEPEGYTSFYQNDAMITDYIDGFILTETAWNFFMISKLFLSESFHTVSIFLTLCLGGQMYASMEYPNKLKLTIEQAVFCCAAIFLMSPILYIKHLIEEKEIDGSGLGGINSQLDITYSWVYISIRHVLPCAVLLLFSALLITRFRSGQKTLPEGSNTELFQRQVENRRESKIVIAILSVLLVQEVPYGIFLLYNIVGYSMKNGWNVSLKTHRLVHLCYEIFLVFSFHINLYIYVFLDRRFRRGLQKTFIKPFQSFFGYIRRTFGTSVSSAEKTDNSTDV